MVTESSTSSERMIERELMVTGEAVALEVIPATAVNRIMSGIIDYTTYSLGGLLSVLALMALILGTGPESALAEHLALYRVLVSLIVLAWMVVIPLLVELLSRGRSLGRTGAVRQYRHQTGQAVRRHAGRHLRGS